MTAKDVPAWLWARSPQTIHIPGFRTEEQASEITGAMQFGPLKPDQMKEIEKMLERLQGFSPVNSENQFNLRRDTVW